MAAGEELKRWLLSALESMEITSANPTHINKLIQVNNIEPLDLNEILEEDIGEGTANIKQAQKTNEAIKKLESWDKGVVGDINRFSSTQIANLKGFVDNPVQFIMGSVFKKFARGLGVAAFALIIFEAVKFIIAELLQPGRLLERRFKLIAHKAIISFRKREDQQKFRQGFSGMIITSKSNLRGGQGQITNTLDLVRLGIFPTQIGANTMLLESSGVSSSKSKGRKRFGR